MKTVIRLTAVMALGLSSTLAGIAHADTAVPSVKVSLSGLNLSSSEGQSVARDRIHNAARVACARSIDPFDLSLRYAAENCVAASEQRAWQQIQAGSMVAKK